MKPLRLTILLLIFSFPLYAAPPVQLPDDQLRAKITGVWFTDELPELLRHIAERAQCFPDGRFVADYRISSPTDEARS